MLSHKILLPVAAAALAAFAVSHAVYLQRPDAEPPPPVAPPVSPFGNTVAGAGMVEPNTEASGSGLIAVGSQLTGTIARICVQIGQEVRAGEVLFELDDRLTRADLEVKEAAVEQAATQYQRLLALPRPEEVPPAEAQVLAAEANWLLARDGYERYRKAVSQGGVSELDLVIKQETAKASLHQLELARANLALLKAGAWARDREIAHSTLSQARAVAAQARVTLDVERVRAPVNGTVLQLNVRPGELVPPAPSLPLVVMGDLSPLHVRVSVDEEDLPRLPLAASARAKVRGDPSQEAIPLSFVRVEPVVVPKTSLTGANTERVDTRVVQLIYAVDTNRVTQAARRLLIGQLVDVYIDATPVHAPVTE